MALANRTGHPEFAISDAEGTEFLGAAQRVLRHYNVAATQRTLDWGAFIFCACAMYLPRLGMAMAGGPAGSQGMPHAAPDGRGVRNWDIEADDPAFADAMHSAHSFGNA